MFCLYMRCDSDHDSDVDGKQEYLKFRLFIVIVFREAIERLYHRSDRHIPGGTGTGSVEL